MQYKTLRVEARPPIAWVVLNRPKSLNALNLELIQELQVAVKDLDRNKDVRVILLRGEGRGFCAGGDLRELTDRLTSPRPGDAFRELVEEVHGMIRAIWDSPKPVVAVVHGAAAGAGCSLALACDFRLAAAGARFQMSFINIGLVADSGSTYLLSRLIGMGKAMEMALLGEVFEAEDLERYGAVNEVVPEAELIPRAEKWAEALGRKSLAALSRTKQLLQEGWGRDLHGQLDAERDAMMDLEANSADFREGIRAFLEKRSPRFGNGQ